MFTAPSLPSDYSGKWLAITTQGGAGVYVKPSFEAKKLGYLRNGGRVPVHDEPVSKERCSAGWYELQTGGFACANLGTTKLDHPSVKYGARQPDLGDILPYPYARNAKNGTPLYRNVPSREQMLEYEPYLTEKKSLPAPPADSAAPSAPDGAPATAAVAPVPEGAASVALISASVVGDVPELPWWQRENARERLHELTISQLESDADAVLAKRMVAGFYVAIDKSFPWNGRTWFKTTKGMIAPSDRFWKTTGSDFQGVEIDGVNVELPLAWVYGGRKSATTYRIDEARGRVTNAGEVERFKVLRLTGRELALGKTRYAELRDGTWVKQAQIRKTEPGNPPAGLGENERWIDVNVKNQTLVAYVGTRPVYATLISSGKESEIEAKDHRTPVGEWRIREKHITSTMDGDGSAAGDLPYSIEDVPYTMFYYKSFALHGAFWHGNYGVRMSHGCVNLSPLDAKHLFFFTDPPIQAGFHGVFASASNPGSRVVVHE